MTARKQPSNIVRYCECGCGRTLGTNIQQRFAPPCRELRAKQQSITNGVKWRRENPGRGARKCACGAEITTRNAHACDPCRVAKALAKLEPKVRDGSNLWRYGFEMHNDYPQVEQFKPWVPKKRPKLMTDAEQQRIDREARRRDDERQGFTVDRGRRLTPAEIAAVAGSITHISQIPWEGGPVYGVGELAF